VRLQEPSRTARRDHAVTGATHAIDNSDNIRVEDYPPVRRLRAAQGRCAAALQRALLRVRV